MFDDKGVLTIECKGKMTDSPWNYSFDDYTAYSESISEIVLPDGFTSINSVFFKCVNLTDIKIPESVTYIGGSANMKSQTFSQKTEYALSECGFLSHDILYFFGVWEVNGGINSPAT